MSGRVLDGSSIVRPGNGWFWVGLDAALKQQAFAIVLLTDGWLLGECWCNTVDLSIFCCWKFIEGRIHGEGRDGVFLKLDWNN